MNATLPRGARVLEVGGGAGGRDARAGHVAGGGRYDRCRSAAGNSEEAAALKAEARPRVASGEHFGHSAYMSLVARTPR